MRRMSQTTPPDLLTLYPAMGSLPELLPRLNLVRVPAGTPGPPANWTPAPKLPGLQSWIGEPIRPLLRLRVLASDCRSAFRMF